MHLLMLCSLNIIICAKLHELFMLLEKFIPKIRKGNFGAKDLDGCGFNVTFWGNNSFGDGIW